jgi:hypothetical protein
MGQSVYLPRNNKSGPVQSDARLGSSDEPVQALARRTGRQGSDRALHRPLNGRFCDQRSRHQGTGRASIGTECASRAQFYEGQLWLRNLSTC